MRFTLVIFPLCLSVGYGIVFPASQIPAPVPDPGPIPIPSAPGFDPIPPQIPPPGFAPAPAPIPPPIAAPYPNFSPGPGFSSACDPFSIGTSADLQYAAISNGIQNPNSCPCKYPCTTSKSRSNVRFYYTKDKDAYFYPLNVNTPTTITLADRQGKIKFLFHGYADKVRFNGTGWMEPMGRALADVIGGVVILVDYGGISSCNYFRAVSEIVPSVGSYVAQLIKYFNLDLSKVEFIGFGIGAHVAGVAGYVLNGNVSRITGLDPSSDYENGSGGLNSSCASFVQVLHTDPEKYGTFQRLGNADFFASRRRTNQPGCTHNFCDHTKSIYYYYASIYYQNGFFGSTCNHTCSTGCASRFGLFNDGRKGSFCMSVGSCYPFALQGVFTTTTAAVFTPPGFSYPPQPDPAYPYPPPPPPSAYPFPPGPDYPIKKPNKKKPQHGKPPAKPCCRRRCRRNCRCCSKK